MVGRELAPRHVLIFMDTSTVSGPLRQLVASLQDLSREHAVTARLVVCTRRGRNVTAIHRYVEDAGLAMVHLEERSRFDWRILRMYRRLMADPRVTCVQTHGYKPTIFVAIQRLFGRREPWIAFFHGRTSETRAVRIFDTVAIRCARLADRIVVVAASQRAHFSGSERLRHIPNAVPVVESYRDGAPPRTSKPQHILYVGRLSPEKGVDLLVHAFYHLRARRPDARLRIIGDGPERPALEGLIKALDLCDAVELLGHVLDAHPFYADARVLCLPSRSEGMPNVVLEAIVSGVPVVATAVGDVAELVSVDVGQVVRPDDVPALTDALERELSMERSAEFIVARQALLERYSRASRARAIRALYDDLLGSAD
jgi:glycosyltransferase involved in cell wall biosynthesis